MAGASSQIDTMDPGTVPKAIDDRVSEPNGTVISGRYRIEGVLGSGGMGTVYLVQHTHMRKRFALKMLHAETSQVPELVARFEREAVAMSRAEHPNIATATDFGRAENGSFFLVIEHLEGYSLRDALKSGRLEVERGVHIARQIASALQRSHELGIIHRDLKPENIMLTARQGDADFVKILDFGLAKLAPGSLEGSESEGPDKTPLTRYGAVFGTPRYMAPEQCIGGQVDARTDLYALGLIMYETLTGVHPFDELDPRKMINHQLVTPIPPMKVRAPGVNIPVALEALVMRAVTKERSQRHANATELLTELAEVCQREGILPPAPAARSASPRSTPPSGTGPQQAGTLPDGPSADGGMTLDVFDAEATQHLSESETVPVHSAAVVAQALVPPLPAAEAVPPPKPVDGPADNGVTQLPNLAPTEMLPATPPPDLAPTEQMTATGENQPDLRPAFMPRKVLWGLALLVPLAILVWTLATRHGEGPAPSTAPVSGLPQPTPPRAPVPSPASSEITFLAELQRATEAGPPELLKLVQTHPTDARLLRALANSYVEQNNGLEALRWQRKALALHESSVYDGDILQAAARAMSNPQSTDLAITMLEHDFGTRGMDVLIALMNRPGLGSAKSRISQSLTKTNVRALASPAALIALDLSTATMCEAKRALFPRAARDGDQRTLQQLKMLSVARGCGVLRHGDCWPCLRKDAALQKAIAAITARASLAH